MGNLTVWVVDFDTQQTNQSTNEENPIIGPAIVKVAKSMAVSSKESLTYTVRSPADFGNDPRMVKQAVYDEHVYAAVIVSFNATATLWDALRNGNSSYEPNEAAQFVTISARDQTTYSSHIDPALNGFEREVITQFGSLWVRELAAQNTSSVLQTEAPQAIHPAIGFERLDLRPFSPAVAVPAVTVGLIYLIILAFFIFPFLMPVHVQLLKGNHPPLKTLQWVAWRILSNITAYFFLSFSYSLVSLAFQIPFTNNPAPDIVSAKNPNAYGRGSFVVFWMLNWVGMSALGFPCENMAMILGAPYSSIFLIFWVISNVATGFYALDLAPSFFRWGYAWPLHRIVEALRTILFGTHSRIGLDFGILFIWIGVSIALYPFANYIMQWKQRRGM